MKGKVRFEAGKVLPRLISAALDLLLPPSCAVCQSQGAFLCEGCEPQLPRLRQPFCPLCANPGERQRCSRCAITEPAYDGIRAPYMMEGAVRDMVYNLKYRNLRASAPRLGALMVAYLESHPIPADVLVPVPLHKRREKARGYNQSALLAREVGRGANVPVAPGVLRRTRDTPPQLSMTSPEERLRNMQGAFEATGDIQRKRVLLVDDVVTTGTTMSACAKPLRDAGAASVRGLALARQP